LIQCQSAIWDRNNKTQKINKTEFWNFVQMLYGL